jgi:type I restriction enzyme R subunit
VKTPSFQEDHISQIPALQLLQNLGYQYLRPQEVYLERRGKLGNVLLENVLAEQLRKLNRITYRGGKHEFSEINIQNGIQDLKDVRFDGLVRTSEHIYDLLSLGKSLEQTIEGDSKSFTLQYIDWRNPKNNAFHVVEEFEVERTGSKELCRPDLVLFVNGIPLGVIECKQSGIKDPLAQAISQQIRNQAEDYIPKLFIYSQVLLGVAVNAAAYATTGTPGKFWAQWRELQGSRNKDISKELSSLVNRPLSRLQKERMFQGRFGYVRQYFEELEAEERTPTMQDETLYCLCRPERFLELAWRFIVYDAGEKKIARYQQYFTVDGILERIREVGNDGRRLGGVVWHTQGSGKSLTMVMLAKSLAISREIKNPIVVLVTDRIDLDDQIKKTFQHCGLEPEQAQTGRHLARLIMEGKHSVITTVLDKFDAALKAKDFKNESSEIFVLVDESHRSVYGEAGAQMAQVLPNACFIGFTGTPLMKQEKNTARKFGGIIQPAYTIQQAVADKAVVPLLYEGRHALQEVNQPALDKWFEVTTAKLNDAQRADLKRKFSTADQLNKAQSRIYLQAYDISEHFSKNWQGTPFKAQLTAPDKASALKFKRYLGEFGKVSSEVLISGPDTREGNEDIYTVDQEEVRSFWKIMMAKYGSEKEYNKQLINAFKHGPEPEIIIVVDKLLTGFDAPQNIVLYICRSLKEHNLLQAIARVNRLYEGKDYGFVIDYYGVIKQLGEAMDLYATLPDFDREDLVGAIEDVSVEIRTLPQKHSELWDIFPGLRNKLDVEEYERRLADEELREKFYEKLCAYHRTLSVALSSAQFLQETPADKIDRYKNDLAFFLKLRVSVKRRYAEEIDYKEYETRVQKLIDTHVDSTEILQITEPINIFEEEKFQAELEKLESKGSKADTIAHRTQRTITEKMEEDPVFYRRFSRILQEAIEEYRQERINETQYLKKATEIMEAVLQRRGDNLPAVLQNRDAAKAFFGVVNEVLGDGNVSELAAGVAIQIDDLIQNNLVVDWRSNMDVQNRIRNGIDDLLYDLKNTGKVELSMEQMDAILERSLEIARNRYAR